MSDHAPKHRRFRFGLRTMFVVVTVLCVGLGWRLQAATQHQSLYARLAQQRVSLAKLPDERDYASRAEYYWCCAKELFAYETVYDVWVDFDRDDPRPNLKADLSALRAMHPRAHFWGNFRGCGQLIDIDELE